MSRVESYAASNLRYVGEAKLARLSDADLLELHRLLLHKLGEPLEPPPSESGKEGVIKAILNLKVKIGILNKAEADAIAALATPQAAAPSAAPLNHVPHEEHDAQGSAEEDVVPNEEGPVAAAKEDESDELSKAAAEFEQLFIERAENTDPTVLAAEAEANRARANAFVQLMAAASPPEPAPAPAAMPEAPAPAAAGEVVVDKHRLRICSFNALKLRLGSANKSYLHAADTEDTEGYEGTQKGAELTQKWLTLSAIMSDFDVILLQEVPGSEKLLEERMAAFAAMLQVATPSDIEWTALPSEKSGKDGKVVGPGAECHVCFVKSPVQLRRFGTLKQVGPTLLDYAPLQVALHDPRFSDAADRDFVVTSVHMPPSPRVGERDTQIAALLRHYSAADLPQNRLDMPWKLDKATGLAPVHVIAGDWNAFPGNEGYDMAASGFTNKIPKQAATTIGHRHYDNILVNAQADERFLIGGGILQLKSEEKGAKATLSDHWPVFVEIMEVEKAGRGAPASPRANGAEKKKATALEPEQEPEPELMPLLAGADARSDACEEEAPPPASTGPSSPPLPEKEAAETAASEAEAQAAPPPPETPEEAPPPRPPAPTEVAPSTPEPDPLPPLQKEEEEPSETLVEELKGLVIQGEASEWVEVRDPETPPRPETPAPTQDDPEGESAGDAPICAAAEVD